MLLNIPTYTEETIEMSYGYHYKTRKRFKCPIRTEKERDRNGRIETHKILDCKNCSNAEVCIDHRAMQKALRSFNRILRA